MKPSIGRIVLFVNKFTTSGEVFPAIITNVWSDTCVNLQVFYDGTNYGVPMGQSQFESSVSFNDQAKPDPRTWHWPPRV